jgi:hypothetical protein
MATNRSHSLWWYVVFPGLAMSLGWGLRGNFGHPMGAAIAGALVVMAICLLLEREDFSYGLVVAFGAVGVGFGGQETYGQTVGFVARAPYQAALGYTGLAVKGALWGLLGGACIGIALRRERFTWKDISVGVGLMIAGTWAGWRLVHEPPRVNFSINRPEVWAGFILGGLLLAGWASWRGRTSMPWRFAGWGALGAGVGFPLGAGLMAGGLGLGWRGPWYDWWKLMEMTLGLLFGVGLGCCAWLNRGRLAQGRAPAVNAARLVWGVAISVAAVGLYYWEGLHPRFPFTLLGGALLIVAFGLERLAWHIGVTMVCCATAANVARHWLGNQKIFEPIVVWTLVALTTAAAAWWVARAARDDKTTVRGAFLALMWSTVLLSQFKTLLSARALRPEAGAGIAQAWGGALPVAAVFTVMAAALTWMTRRLSR